MPIYLKLPSDIRRILPVFILFSSCLLQATVLHADTAHYVWAKAMGGIFDEEGRHVTIDKSGNVYTVGNFNGTVDFDPDPGVFNLTNGGHVFVSKLDSNGNFVWAIAIGEPDPLRDHVYINGNSIFVDDSGNIYITGSSSFYNSREVTFIDKLDPNGNVIWAKYLSSESCHSCYNEGYDIFVDNSGNVYTTGTFDIYIDLDPGPGVFDLSTGIDPLGIFISKLDSNGNFIWGTSIGEDNLGAGAGIIGDAYGNIYISGNAGTDQNCDTIRSSPGGINILSKLDSNGNCVWANFGEMVTSYHSPNISIDNFGNIYNIGGFSGTVDFDPDTGVVNLTSAGGSDISIRKLDNSGKLLWAKSFGGISKDWGESIVIGDSGNIYTTGYFSGTADFDPGPGVFNLTSAGEEDFFISELDSNGNFVWAIAMGGIKKDAGQSIAVDSLDNVYTTGVFAYTVDFDPSAEIHSLMSAGGVGDIFVAKYIFGEPGPFKLSVSLNGDGKVTSSPSGISCPGNCTGLFAKNTLVQLTAEPSQGSIFGSWSYDSCKGSGTCTVTMDGDQKVTASFGMEGGLPWSILLLKDKE